MAILRRKARIVTFRLSIEEYDALTKMCLTLRARSISDFARVAVLDRLQTVSAPRINISGHLTTLGKLLGELDAPLRDASARIRHLLGPVNSEAKNNHVTNNR